MSRTSLKPSGGAAGIRIGSRRATLLEEGGSFETGALPSSDDILKSVRDLPAMPTVVVKIMRMTGQSAGNSSKEVAGVISQDPSFSARILKMANSAYYGLPRSVSTLSDAVLMLGNHSVRNMAMLAAASDSLNQRVEGYALRPGELWRRSLMRAWAAQALSEKTLYRDKEVAFVAGLLQDVGKIALGPHIGGRASAIRAAIQERGCSFVEAERAVLGFDHAEIGGKIALHWNLPSSLVNAIAFHHEPVQRGCVNPLVALVCLSDAICALAMEEEAESLASEAGEKCMEVLCVERRHIFEVARQLQEQQEAILSLGA